MATSMREAFKAAKQMLARAVKDGIDRPDVDRPQGDVEEITVATPDSHHGDIGSNGKSVAPNADNGGRMATSQGRDAAQTPCAPADRTSTEGRVEREQGSGWSRGVLNLPDGPVGVSPSTSFAVKAARGGKPLALSGFEVDAVPLQAAGRTAEQQAEIVLALDFGTSSVKAALGDSQIEKTFAVPFRRVDGVDRYVLSSLLFQTGSEYSLTEGKVAHRDLKLALLECPDDADIRCKAAAFLALVIRQARGWFLSDKRTIYRDTELVWTMCLGLPTAQCLNDRLRGLFEVIGAAAWIVAGSPGRVTNDKVNAALNQVSSGMVCEDLEIRVIPEIAGQIFGFVQSTSFDRRADNIYLMVDVGAGTVDASLFYVKPSRASRFDFHFYTSVVERLGAANLHRHRVGCWISALEEAQAPKELVDQLEESRVITDDELRIPERFWDYLAPIKFRGDLSSSDADRRFRSKLVRQIQGDVFFGAYKENQVPAHQLERVPMFLCGGGSRMAIYHQVIEFMKRIPQYPRMGVRPRQLQLPDDFEAPGLRSQDYDRLSVAYGLSRLQRGRIVDTEPMTPIISQAEGTISDRFVSKDMC